MEPIKNDIREFIVDRYLAGRDSDFSDHDSFLEKGILDSIGVIEVISFLQDRFSIKIAVPEIIPENFDSVVNIVSFVNRKRAHN